MEVLNLVARLASSVRERGAWILMIALVPMREWH